MSDLLVAHAQKRASAFRSAMFWWPHVPLQACRAGEPTERVGTLRTVQQPYSSDGATLEWWKQIHTPVPADLASFHRHCDQARLGQCLHCGTSSTGQDRCEERGTAEPSTRNVYCMQHVLENASTIVSSRNCWKTSQMTNFDSEQKILLLVTWEAI